MNVAKACTTIIHPPGAPLALRTQANLLYGVTRVFQEQYRIALSDVEKFQDHLRRARSTWGTSDIDSNAGKARCVVLDQRLGESQVTDAEDVD